MSSLPHLVYHQHHRHHQKVLNLYILFLTGLTLQVRKTAIALIHWLQKCRVKSINKRVGKLSLVWHKATNIVPLVESFFQKYANLPRQPVNCNSTRSNYLLNHLKFDTRSQKKHLKEKDHFDKLVRNFFPHFIQWPTFSLVSLCNDISTLVGYLMPKPSFQKNITDTI